MPENSFKTVPFNYLLIASTVLTFALQNAWSPEQEAQFQSKATKVIEQLSNRKYGNSFGENEKSSYPRAMFDILAGSRTKPLAFLQAEDPEAIKHQHTEGIDYYYCFTLKGQIRKYFLFGHLLNPAYKERMFRGAQAWTQQDPLQTPHPIYGFGDSSSGGDWDIQRQGRWVDPRNTDNLRAMREVAVYLMAEETGNEVTRMLYKNKLQRYVWALYNIGMGEWDSDVYHGHTFAAYLNLYDFAKDSEVQILAKAALDWLSASAAVKYYRGGWGGPVKRDYGKGNVVLGSTAARTFWMYFDDTPIPNNDPPLDTLYLITSKYRPPAAIVALAQKKFSKPVEILATKPMYQNWKPGNDRQPAYWETTYIGDTYQMGSIASSFPDGDVAPFKLMAYNYRRGVDYFIVNTGGNGVKPGKNPQDQIAQYKNTLIWLRSTDKVPFFFQMPQTATTEVVDGVWFIRLQKTWLAIHPINLHNYKNIEVDKKQYPQEQTWQATAKSHQAYTGFALVVGESSTYGTYENFRKVVLGSTLNLKGLNQGVVELNNLRLQYNKQNLLPIVFRNNLLWQRHYALYNSKIISLGWKTGTLQVKAGGKSFDNSVANFLPKL